MKLFSVLALAVPVLSLNAPTTIGSHAAAVALRVPRGGGDFPIKPNQMVKLFCSFYALNGALSMPAPESAKDFALKEGNPDYIAFENLGAISLSYAALVYFTAFSNRSAPKVVALSSLPYTYVTYKNTLKGIVERLSGSKIRGPASTAFLVGCAYCILEGKGNAERIATLLAIPALIIGVASELDIGLGMKLAGFGSSLAGKKAQAIYVWYAALMAGWGALALMRLQSGLSAMDAIARAALIETVFMIDCIWIRKWNVGVAPDASNYVFLGIPLLTAVALLLR